MTPTATRLVVTGVHGGGWPQGGFRSGSPSLRWKHAHSPRSNGRYRSVTNVCGEPNSLQIRLTYAATTLSHQPENSVDRVDEI
jgi:hypothetical protein